jgi:hypothetical protein
MEVLSCTLKYIGQTEERLLSNINKARKPTGTTTSIPDIQTTN